MERESDGNSSAAERVSVQLWGMLPWSGTREAGDQAAGPPLSPYIPLHRTHTSMAEQKNKTKKQTRQKK